MKNYSEMYDNAVENNATPQEKMQTEKRELSTSVPAEKNTKLTKKISKKKQELTNIRKELIELKNELRKHYELIAMAEAEMENNAWIERLEKLFSIGTYCETLPFSTTGKELKKACVSIINNELESYEIKISHKARKPVFSYWKNNTENAYAVQLMGKIEKLQGKNESISGEIAQLKKSYTLESLLYVPTVKNFWRDTIYDGYESYLVYLLIFRKSYNYKLFMKTYETPVDEIINVVSVQLLSAEKIAIAEKIIAETNNEIERKEKLKALIANTTRRAMINFARVITLDITISERAIENERKREKAENKAHRHMLRVKKLATAGKVQHFLSNAMNRNAQMKRRLKAVKTTLKGFRNNEKVVETVDGWKIENGKTQSSISYYNKNVKPLLEAKACLANGAHESMKFDNMKETTREVAPFTFLQFYKGFSVAEIARKEGVSAPTIYNTLRAEKDALRAELKRRA